MRLRGTSVPLPPKTFGDAYGLVWQHLTGRHDLNPNVNEAPGLEAATFFADLSNGRIEVRMSLADPKAVPSSEAA